MTRQGKVGNAPRGSDLQVPKRPGFIIHCVQHQLHPALLCKCVAPSGRGASSHLVWTAIYFLFKVCSRFASWTDDCPTTWSMVTLCTSWEYHKVQTVCAPKTNLNFQGAFECSIWVHPGSLVVFVFHYLLGSGSSRLPALTECLRNRDTLSARLDFHTAQTLALIFFPLLLEQLLCNWLCSEKLNEARLTASLSLSLSSLHTSNELQENLPSGLRAGHQGTHEFTHWC